ncbi:MAG: glycosyltransferase [Streptococcaceae bacterium]|jgi:glycosyltransferase involved in cell wall biosynthesis|nr:glycosyltransferase [Streptococcaceae bacterium]
MTEKLISIIIPVYNSEKFLRRTLQSVLEQSYQNFELLLIDDGSTDGSGQICDDFASKDLRVKVFHMENSGISSAQNKGLDEAKGAYITFCDNDDIYHPQYLEVLAYALENTEADIAKGRTASIGISELENLAYSSFQVNKLNLTSFSNPLKKYHDIFIKSVKMWGKTAYYFNEANWCKLYKRELFDKIRFPLDKYAQDVAIVGDLLIRAEKVVDVDAVIYYWIQHSNSVTHDKAKRRDYKFLEDNIYAGTQGFDVALKNGIAPFRSYFILETTLRDIKRLDENHEALVQQIERDYLKKMPHKFKAKLLNLVGRFEYIFYEKLVHNKK